MLLIIHLNRFNMILYICVIYYYINVLILQVNVRTTENNVELLRIDILEEPTSNLKPSVLGVGGTSFRVEVTSNKNRNLCPYKDYFNGTYSTWCTIDTTYLTGQYDVTIYTEFTDFRAFHKFHSARRNIWNRSFPVLNYTSMNSSQYPLATCNSSVQKPDFFHGYWLQISGHHHFLLPDRIATHGYCVYTNIDQNVTTACFRDIFNETFDMFGDSQIRYAFYYMTNVTGGRELWQNEQHSITEQKRIFIWTTLCHRLSLLLDDYIKKRTMHAVNATNVSHLLVLGVGAWDMDFNTTQVIVNA